MIKLDKTKLEEARKFVDRAHETIEIECTCCQGMGGHVSKPCAVCNNRGKILVLRVTQFWPEDQINYWQARTLLCEHELKSYQKKVRQLLKERTNYK